MTTWLNNLRGRFLVFDGPDGSGKSTQFARFVDHARKAGLAVCDVREPGGTEIGEQMRRILLDPANTSMTLRAEMLLYMASRAQLVEQRIAPALARKEIVLADRFISSTLAYQGTAGGLSRDEILAVGNVAVGKFWPDLTIIFDVDEQTATRRMMGSPKKAARGGSGSAAEIGLFSDRMESRGLEFRRKVRQGYLDQVAADRDHYLLIDARGEEEAVFASLLAGLERAASQW